MPSPVVLFIKSFTHTVTLRCRCILSSSFCKFLTSSMNSPTNPVEDSPAESAFSATGKRLSASKSRSRSSSSSSLSSSPSARDSPSTPLQSSGVPFSWEHQPGVPKHLMGTPDLSHFCVVGPSLPPPPPLSSSPAGVAGRLAASDSIFTSRSRKVKSHEKSAHDPFFKALVECSKDQMADSCWQSRKAPCKFRPAPPLRGLDRLQISCKTNCAVLESQVLLPRSYRTTSYGLLTNRSI